MYKDGSLPRYGYPGDGYYYGICDICGFKMRVKDLIFVEGETYNRINGLAVCKKDYSPAHLDQYRYIPKDTFMSNPKKVRPEGETTFFVGSAEDL